MGTLKPEEENNGGTKINDSGAQEIAQADRIS